MRHLTIPAMLAFALAAWATVPAAARPAPVAPLPLPGPARAALAPGVTYQRSVLAGGEVIHVIRFTPGPLTSLVPTIVSGRIGAGGDLAAAVARQTAGGVVAAVNGDFFNFANAYPSGVTVTPVQGLVSTPNVLRSALVIGADGSLSLARVALAAKWTPIDASGAAVAPGAGINGINRPAARPSEELLFTPAYGPTIPPLPTALPPGAAGHPPTIEASAAILPDTPGPLTPNQPVTGTVTATTSAQGVAIPAGGFVLTGVGAEAGTVASELTPGTRVMINPGLSGAPPGASVLGGGPALVVSGRPIAAAGEGFTPSQLVPRSQRTGIGQTAPGAVLLVSAEGPEQGSPGITVPQQAALMARLGARTAIAMDSGGSTEMIAGGTDAIAWRSPRAISTAAIVRYSGVRIGPLRVPISPDGDGVADRASLRVIVPGPGTLAVTLTRAGRVVDTLLRAAVPGVPVPVEVDPAALGLPDGQYRVAAAFTSLSGTVTTDSQPVTVDRTLGGLGVRTAGREVRVAFRLARSAVVRVRAATPAGRTLWAATPRRDHPGRYVVVVGHAAGPRRAPMAQVITVTAASGLGTHGLMALVRVP